MLPWTLIVTLPVAARAIRTLLKRLSPLVALPFRSRPVLARTPLILLTTTERQPVR
jgi:hypothetical protein